MLVGVLLSSGCTPVAAPGGAAPGLSTAAERTVAAQVALDDLVDSAQTGDRPAFDRGVSLRDPSFTARARLLYTNLNAVPFAELRFRLEGGEAGLGEERRRLLGADAWRQQATVSWRLGGETAPAEHLVWLTFVLDGDTPLLAGTLDRPVGEAVPEPLWWVGPVTAAQRGPATVLVGSGQPASEWLKRAVRAAGQVRRRLTTGSAADWSGQVTVEVPADRRGFEAVVGAEDGTYARIAAVALAEGPVGTAPVRVVVNPEVTRTLDPLGVAVVLTHETVHVATRSADSPAPLWVVEGLADWTALQAYPQVGMGAAEPLLREVRAQGPPARLPADDRFRAGATDLDVSYAEAWLACRYIAETWSPAALQRFHVALDAGQPIGEVAEQQLGVDEAELTSGWRDYLRRLAGV